MMMYTGTKQKETNTDSNMKRNPHDDNDDKTFGGDHRNIIIVNSSNRHNSNTRNNSDNAMVHANTDNDNSSGNSRNHITTINHVKKTDDNDTDNNCHVNKANDNKYPTNNTKYQYEYYECDDEYDTTNHATRNLGNKTKNAKISHTNAKLN